jgi:hypothetical protein
LIRSFRPELERRIIEARATARSARSVGAVGEADAAAA